MDLSLVMKGLLLQRDANLPHCFVSAFRNANQSQMYLLISISTDDCPWTKMFADALHY